MPDATPGAICVPSKIRPGQPLEITTSCGCVVKIEADASDGRPALQVTAPVGTKVKRLPRDLDSRPGIGID